MRDALHAARRCGVIFPVTATGWDGMLLIIRMNEGRVTPTDEYVYYDVIG